MSVSVSVVIDKIMSYPDGFDFWSYDSCCNDNVFEYMNDIDKTKPNIVSKHIIDAFNQIQDDAIITENDMEFMLGIVIWSLRNNIYTDTYILKETKNIAELLIKNGKFKKWKNKKTRISRILLEIKILDKKILNNNINLKLSIKNKPNTIIAV